MTALSFIKSTKGKVILGTVAALHLAIYVAKPSHFKGNEDKKGYEQPPKYLP